MHLPLLNKEKRQVIDAVQTDELSELIEMIKIESRIGKYEDCGAHARGLYSLGKPWLYEDSFSHRLLRVRLLERSLSNAAIRAVNIITQEVFPAAQFEQDSSSQQQGMIITDADSFTAVRASQDRAVNVNYALAFTSGGRVWGSYRRDYSHRQPIEAVSSDYDAHVALSFYREQAVTGEDMEYLLGELSTVIALERRLREGRDTV